MTRLRRVILKNLAREPGDDRVGMGPVEDFGVVGGCQCSVRVIVEDEGNALGQLLKPIHRGHKQLNYFQEPLAKTGGKHQASAASGLSVRREQPRSDEKTECLVVE